MHFIITNLDPRYVKRVLDAVATIYKKWKADALGQWTTHDGDTIFAGSGGSSITPSGGKFTIDLGHEGVERNCTPGQGAKIWVEIDERGGVLVESLVSMSLDPMLSTVALNALSDGALALRPLFEASDAITGIREVADASALRTYFDSYGDLRFTSLEGVLVQQPTAKMQELIALSVIEADNDQLNELLHAYEGTVDALHDRAFRIAGLSELIAHPQRPVPPPDPERSKVAREAARRHASSREAAARRSASSAKGKRAHAAVGRLRSRRAR